MASRPNWLARLRGGPALLLDGATGTELERRGAPAQLPLWSAGALLHCPDLVRAIHADYSAAGAEILTANTFRTQRRTLARAGLAGEAARLTRLAVALAREAAGPSVLAVLGSQAPLEDCFRPDLVPADPLLADEHAEHAANLAAAGVDGILVETMNTAREAAAAAAAAAATGLPVWVSFACGPGARLLSGEGLAPALDAVRAAQPAALLVNCLPPPDADSCLEVLRGAGLPFGIYANLGAPVGAAGARSHDCTPEEYAHHAQRWLAAGARIVGGCCGTTPDHIRALSHLLARTRES
jgi:S-methylmethionine-dependent homocysteine/selenocysteine methylase